MSVKPDKPFGPSRTQYSAHVVRQSASPCMPIPSYILPVGRFVQCRQSQYCSGVEERTVSFGPAIPICRAGRQVEYQGLWEFREKEDVIEAGTPRPRGAIRSTYGHLSAHSSTPSIGHPPPPAFVRCHCQHPHFFLNGCRTPQ